MKLIFSKDEEKNICVELFTGTEKRAFSYIEFVKSLWEKNELEEPEFCDEITDDEKSRLSLMIKRINEAVAERKTADVEEELKLDDETPDLEDDELGLDELDLDDEIVCKRSVNRIFFS